MTRTELLSLAEQLRTLALWSGHGEASEAADLCEKLAELRPVAWLHDVVQGSDNEPDQALSFEPDNFPLMGDAPHLFRSVGNSALYQLSEVLTDE